MQFQGKPMIKTKGQPHFRPDLDPLDPNANLKKHMSFIKISILF